MYIQSTLPAVSTKHDLCDGHMHASVHGNRNRKREERRGEKRGRERAFELRNAREKQSLRWHEAPSRRIGKSAIQLESIKDTQVIKNTLACVSSELIALVIRIRTSMIILHKQELT